MSRRVHALGLALTLVASPAFAQQLDLCLTMAEGSKGDVNDFVEDFKNGGQWPVAEKKYNVYNSVRAITSLDARQGCDAVVAIRVIDGDFWNEAAAQITIFSGVTGKELWRDRDKGWSIVHSWYIQGSAADHLAPGTDAYQAIQQDKLAQCSSSAPPDTPLCRQLAEQKRQGEENARRYAAEQAARNEAKVREEIPAWRALKQKPPLPQGAHKYQVLADDALNDKNFEAAANYYDQALAIEPLWPEGQYNVALIDGELHRYAQAASHMRLYLEMVPNAADAQAAQDKIIVWDEKAKR